METTTNRSDAVLELTKRIAWLEARERLEAERTRARRTLRRRVARATALTIAIACAGYASREALAQACAGPQNQSGVLNTFCPSTPARSSEVNHNFATIANWIAQKLGPPGSPVVTTPSDVHVGAYLDVQQGAQFQCSGCGSGSTLRGGADWGDLTIQGRVVSASNNLHLSPPGGASVIINGDYRAAGGGTGPVGLSVSGNVSAPGNGWDSATSTGGSGTSYASEPTGDGWGRGRQACNEIRSYSCPNGQYVCGIDFWHGCGWNWYDEVTRVRCCSL